MSTLEAPPPAAEDLAFDVTSETGLIERLIVHTPGREMELVSPDNRLELLFDDILFLSQARKEHQLMCRLVEKMVGESGAVLQLGDLLREAFEQEDARADFIERLCRTRPAANLRVAEDALRRLAPEELHRFALTGQSRLPVQMQPIPNLMFTRDLAATVHDHVILSHAATAARSRESIVISVVLHHHSAFAAGRERVVTLPEGVTFEGGDLLMASPKVALIGHSERTSYSGVMAVAHALFARTPVEHVLMVDLPKRRSCMHLDTVFTFASPGECVVFPPLLEGGAYGYAVHIQKTDTPGRFLTDMRPRLKDVLEELLEHSLTFIPCGGPDALHQQREQWTDGANLFAIAPGMVVGYERNHRTFEQMSRHGYRVVSAEGFLQYHEESTYAHEPDRKLAVKLEGTELSRGRGGPRCMTMPLSRE